MAATYKVLGQAAPAAGANVDLYACPPGTQAVTSTITVCNRGNAVGTYRLAVRVAGASLTAACWVVYDAVLPADSTDAATLGLTLGESDVVTAWASTADFSFNLFGMEIA